MGKLIKRNKSQRSLFFVALLSVFSSATNERKLLPRQASVLSWKVILVRRPEEVTQQRHCALACLQLLQVVLDLKTSKMMPCTAVAILRYLPVRAYVRILASRREVGSRWTP